jgi:hypothetical protein
MNKSIFYLVLVFMVLLGGTGNPAAIRGLDRDSMEAITGQVTQNNK